MRAILSDIHGNLEALTAVLADVKRLGIPTIYCLGDTVGYGPNPVECLDLVRTITRVLKGAFDHAVLHGPDDFPLHAGQSIYWTQTQLRPDQFAFLETLAPNHAEGGVSYVYGSAANPLNQFLFPDDVHNRRKLNRICRAFNRLCFAGQTHIPGIFNQIEDDEWEYVDPSECPHGFVVVGRKVICNVGSVGQPRDQDPRAGYVLFDDSRIWFRRVEYDIDATIRKIYAVPELANFLGDRLREGR